MSQGISEQHCCSSSDLLHQGFYHLSDFMVYHRDSVL